jgi:hypothetical protein
MKIIIASVVFALSSLSLPLTSAFGQTDQQPPTAHIVGEDFAPMQQQWEPVSGTWTVADGTYGNSSAAGTDLTRITHYRDVRPADEGGSVLGFGDFTAHARMRNSGTSDANLVGLVYGFQDAQNYYEVVISAIGTVTMRTVMSGVAVDEAPPSHQNIPRNTWFDVEVRWIEGVASLKVNGVNIFTNVSQREFTTGQVGLVTHNAVGRFDNVTVGVPFGDQPFLETFNEAPFVTFRPLSGQWAVAGGIYRNSAVQPTSITLSPIRSGDPFLGDTQDYTLRVRMLNPYGASGNLVGIVFNYLTSEYTEVVFGPTGVASVRRFENGAVRTIATANYGGKRNVAFEVTLENGPGEFGVIANGHRLFQGIDQREVNGEIGPEGPEGNVGLITHWSPGRFDNVQFDHGVFEPCSFKFDSPPPDAWIVSGSWNGNGGTLNNTSVDASDIVNPTCVGNRIGPDAGTNEIYSATLRNEFGAAGNQVGLLFNYEVDSVGDDYNEVVFSNTAVQLRKFIEGVRYTIVSVPHNIPHNTPFNVQLIRNGIRTTVKVNGTTVINGAIQGQLTGGQIGVGSHWTKGHYDNLSLTEFVTRPPSEL